MKLDYIYNKLDYIYNNWIIIIYNKSMYNIDMFKSIKIYYYKNSKA